MLGHILSIGNVLNGGTPKGQSDGYELQVLGKVHSFRDNNGQSILEWVCKKMTEENEEFPNIVRSIFKEINIRGTDLDVYKTIA
jgi:hypothetical protein